MTLRELIMSVDVEDYADNPLYLEPRNVKYEL